MEKTIKLVSNSLSSLNNNLQNLTLNEKISKFTPVIVEADGKFTSIVKTDDNFDPSSLNSNVDIEDENKEAKETKQQLLNRATDALKQTLENSKQLDEILNKIKELAKETGNEWVVNKQGNTASLANKNAYIFKQNNNLCLSHSGKIELFKSVKELRNWLEDNGYPLPTEDVVIHESVQEELKEEGRDWYDLLLQRTEQNKVDYKPTATNKQSLGDDDPIQRGLSKRVDKKDLSQKPESKPFEVIDKTNIEFEEEPVDECFGGAVTGVANLGSAVSMLATKNKKESKKEKDNLQEKAGFISGQDFDQWGKAANSLFNPAVLEKIKSGQLSLPSNVADLFYGAQMAKMGYDLKAKTSDGWNKCTAYGLRKEAEKLIKNPTIDFKKQTKMLLSDPTIAGLNDEDKKKAIYDFATNYVKNNPTTENLANISKILNDYVVYYKATGKELKTALNKSMNDMLYQSIVDPVVNKYLELNPTETENFVELQSGDSISYDKAASDDLDAIKKFTITKAGNTENRSKWQTYFYSAQKSFEKQVDALYDAIFGPDSKAKIDSTPNENLHNYVAKNLPNTTLVKELTDEDKKKLTGKSSKAKKSKEKEIEQPGFSKEDLELLKSKNINLEDFDKETVEKILNLLKTNKISKESVRSSIQESANNHPWIKKLIGTRLVEDDTPADFATGQPVIDQLNSIGNTSSDTTTDTTSDTAVDIPDVDLNGTSDTNNDFGDIDVSLKGDYDPEDAEEDPINVPNMPDQKIVDVLMNNDDPSDIKVKVQNQETKETELKNLDEIDV